MVEEILFLDCKNSFVMLTHLEGNGACDGVTRLVIHRLPQLVLHLPRVLPRGVDVSRGLQGAASVHADRKLVVRC